MKDWGIQMQYFIGRSHRSLLGILFSLCVSFCLLSFQLFFLIDKSFDLLVGSALRTMPYGRGSFPGSLSFAVSLDLLALYSFR